MQHGVRCLLQPSQQIDSKHKLAEKFMAFAAGVITLLRIIRAMHAAVRSNTVVTSIAHRKVAEMSQV